MNKRHLAPVASVLAASALLLTACGGGGGSTSAKEPDLDISDRYTPDASTPAWQLDTEEEITELTWYVNADWWNDSWGEDLVTKKMQEDLKVKIKFLKGDDTKLNTMFASGDLPCMVTIFDSTSKVATGAASWAYSLDELAEKYDPYWFEVASEDTLNWHRLDDGQVYGYPSYSNTQADYDEGLIPSGTAFLIQKDIYEALGEPKFDTPEDFRASMQLIKEKYPQNIPFGFNAMSSGTGSLGGSLQDYLGVPLEDETGGFYNRNLDDGYLVWIETLRQVHADGGISDDSFADDGTAFEEKMQTGRYATMFLSGLAQASTYLQMWKTASPDSEYIAVQGPASVEGYEPTLDQSGITGWMQNFISKKCSDPAKAMQVFTYLQSDYGQMLTTFGIEGETYQVLHDGSIELLPEVMDMKANDTDRFNKEYRLSQFIFFGHDRYNAMGADSMQIPATIQPMDWGREYLHPHFILENTDPDTGTAEARNLATINPTWATTLVSMLRAKSDSKSQEVLDSYIAFLNQNGWDAIVEVKTEKMERNRETLGIDS